jgi:hypothetical protein
MSCDIQDYDLPTYPMRLYRFFHTALLSVPSLGLQWPDFQMMTQMFWFSLDSHPQIRRPFMAHGLRAVI